MKPKRRLLLVEVLRRFLDRKFVRKTLSRGQLLNEPGSDKIGRVGNKGASHDEGSSVVGPSKSDFHTKSMAEREKLLANMRLQGLLFHPKFKCVVVNFHPLVIALPVEEAVVAVEVRFNVVFICYLVQIVVGLLIFKYNFGLFHL